MRHCHLLFLFLFLTISGCKRHLSTAQVKENLEKAMAGYLKQEQGANAGQLRFEMVDVDYFEEMNFYDCEFKVRLFRTGMTDTTGIIKGKISKDFSKVTKKW